MDTTSQGILSSLVPNEEQINSEQEKIDIVLNNLKERQLQSEVAIQNEENAIKLMNQLHQQSEEASLLATQLVNNPTTTQETKHNLIDNANNLAYYSQNAQYEALKATEQRIKANKMVEIANQQAKVATDLMELNNKLDILMLNIPAKKHNVVDSFQLKCPDGFYQQGIMCSRLIQMNKSKLKKRKGKKIKKSNILLILLILCLMTWLVCRNSDVIQSQLSNNNINVDTIRDYVNTSFANMSNYVNNNFVKK